MDVKLINPFIDAMVTIMPQLGFQKIVRGNISVGDKFVESRGVTVLLGLTDQIRGNIAYNMTEDTAKKIASTMMMGMPVTEMNEMAQSAISEMTNMLTGNAAVNFEKLGMQINISPPSLIIGDTFRAKVSDTKFLKIEILIDSEAIEINIGVEP